MANNIIENMWNGKKQAAIHFVGTHFKQCRVHDNTIIGGLYDIWTEQEATDWLYVEGNMLN